MKKHEMRRYEVLLQLREAETLPPAYEMNLPFAACVAEAQRELEAYDIEARKTHLFGKPVGNVRLQVQAYDAMTLVLVVTETMEDTGNAPVETAGEPVHLSALAGRTPETAWKMVVANDIDATLLDFCKRAIEQMKGDIPAFAKIKNRLRGDYREIDEIYDPHYVRLEVVAWEKPKFGIPMLYPGVPLLIPPNLFPEKTDKPENWELEKITCIWKAKDGSYVWKEVDAEALMGTVLLEAYWIESQEPYRGELSVWKGDDAYVFMKHGASAGSKWAKAKERADAVVIPCRAEETVRQHFMAAVKQMNKRKQRETTESLK